MSGNNARLYSYLYQCTSPLGSRIHYVSSIRCLSPLSNTWKRDLAGVRVRYFSSRGSGTRNSVTENRSTKLKPERPLKIQLTSLATGASVSKTLPKTGRFVLSASNRLGPFPTGDPVILYDAPPLTRFYAVSWTLQAAVVAAASFNTWVWLTDASSNTSWWVTMSHNMSLSIFVFFSAWMFWRQARLVRSISYIPTSNTATGDGNVKPLMRIVVNKWAPWGRWCILDVPPASVTVSRRVAKNTAVNDLKTPPAKKPVFQRLGTDIRRSLDYSDIVILRVGETNYKLDLSGSFKDRGAGKECVSSEYVSALTRPGFDKLVHLHM